MTSADEARFWEKVNRRGPQECWPWVAGSFLRNRSGENTYGLFTMANGKNGGIKHSASRVACFLGNGPAPYTKARALHSCDNPPCCNPAHLRWGTQKENVHDAIERGRASKPPRNATYRRRDTQPKGEQVKNSVLTEAKTREAWRLHLQGWNVSEIASAVGVGKYAVADLVRGKTWRHLEGAPTIEELRAGGVRRGYNQFSHSLRSGRTDVERH